MVNTEKYYKLQLDMTFLSFTFIFLLIGLVCLFFNFYSLSKELSCIKQGWFYEVKSYTCILNK